MAVAHNWINSISTSGVPSQTQPDATDVTFTQTGTGAALATVNSKLDQYVSLLDFGAVADGGTAYSSTNATTNATALMNALATGKEVFIPYNANGYSFIGNTIAVRCRSVHPW